MVYNEKDREFLKLLRNWGTGISITFLLIGVFVIVTTRIAHRDEGLIRESNVTVLNQQYNLHQLLVDYYTATDLTTKDQIISQMRLKADLIPGNVPSDIAQFLSDKRS